MLRKRSLNKYLSSASKSVDVIQNFENLSKFFGIQDFGTAHSGHLGNHKLTTVL